MFPVVSPSKVCHAVEAGKGGAATLAVMRIDFLLREDIAAVLRQHVVRVSNTSPAFVRDGGVSKGVEGQLSYLAGKRHHHCLPPVGIVF